MKKGLIRALSLMIASSLVIGLAGCSKNGSENKSTSANDASSSKKLIKLDVFSMTANSAGDQTGWFGKVLKDKFNVELNIISSNLQGGDSKFATMMAAENLGDIVVFGQDDQKYQDAIKAGLLLDWTKDDLLNKYGKNILTYPKAIEKNKTNFGKGSAVYGLGHNVSNMPASAPSDGIDMTYGLEMRWDLYEKLGKPAINTMEDLLPILKQMQELCPKSDSGKPTYGMSMWGDWDGNLMMVAKQFACMYGYDELGFLLIHANQEKYQDLLDPEGYYLRTLKMYYNANKMGLVDPDSISQKFDDASNKLRDGQVLFTWFPWLESNYNTPERLAEGKGLKTVPFKEEKIYSNGFANYGANQVLAIGSKTKYAERCMELVDWLYSNEGVMVSDNGPKGLTWDIKDGKPYRTDFGKKALPSGDVQVPAEYGGGAFKDGVNAMNIKTINVNSINPEYNEPYDFRLWTSTLNENPSKLETSWRTAMGTLTSKEYLVKNNMVEVAPVTTFSSESLDSTNQQKMNQIATVIKQNSWKMVFAKNDSEFADLQKDMVTKAKGLGYDDVVKFWQGQAKRLFEARKKAK